MNIGATERRSAFATVVEASEWLGVSRGTVYKEMSDGHIAWTKIAGCRRISWQELERYAARNTHKALNSQEAQ